MSVSSTERLVGDSSTASESSLAGDAAPSDMAAALVDQARWPDQRRERAEVARPEGKGRPDGGNDPGPSVAQLNAVPSSTTPKASAWAGVTNPTDLAQKEKPLAGCSLTGMAPELKCGSHRL